jgi:TRAP-type C4-dicarboxylate transport system permease large subunit
MVVGTAMDMTPTILILTPVLMPLVVAGVGNVSMDAVTKGVIPFMIAEFIVMFAMVLFPKLVTVPAHWFY